MTCEKGKLVEGLTYEEYAAEPGLRASDLHIIHRSPAHWLAAQSEPRIETEALADGKNLHLAVENPPQFMSRLVEMPAFTGKTKDGRDSPRSGEAKQRQAEWLASLPADAIVVSREKFEMLTGMLQSILKHKLLKNLIHKGVRETSLWVDDPETGLTLKCRPDFISTRLHVVDFKTARDARPIYFLNQVFSDRLGSPFYILSAAHYAHCAKLARVARHDMFVLVAIEKIPPYGIWVHPLDAGALDVGERHRQRLTKLFASCKARGEYPCYPEKAIPVQIPGWVQYPEEEAWAE